MSTVDVLHQINGFSNKTKFKFLDNFNIKKEERVLFNLCHPKLEHMKCTTKMDTFEIKHSTERRQKPTEQQNIPKKQNHTDKEQKTIIL